MCHDLWCMRSTWKCVRCSVCGMDVDAWAHWNGPWVANQSNVSTPQPQTAPQWAASSPQQAPSFPYAAPSQQTAPNPWADGQHAMQQQGWDDMRMWRIDRRDTQALSKFDATVGTFKTWRDRIVQHVARSNTNWVPLLTAIKKRTEPIDIAEVRAEVVHGVPAEQLGIEIYNFVTEWVADTVFRNRQKYAPEYHGFELWRRFHQQFEGQGTLVDSAGYLELQNFPRCASRDGLNQHLHDWKQMFELYG